MTAEFPARCNGSFVRVGAVGGGIDCKEKPFCLFLSFGHESLRPDCGLSGEELGYTVVHCGFGVGQSVEQGQDPCFEVCGTTTLTSIPSLGTRGCSGKFYFVRRCGLGWGRRGSCALVA